MNEAIGLNANSAAGVTATERNQALAQARQRATQGALQRAEQAESQRADSRQNVREIFEQALGANTRLSITRDEVGPTFVYRAIDVDSGEVVHEWPPAEFAAFLAENGNNIDLAALAGSVVDEEV